MAEPIDSPRLRDLKPQGTEEFANRHLRTVLRSKGYQVEHAEFNGGHDYACWRGSLTDGLTSLV